MFMREWDKVVHLKSYHGILVDDDWLVMSGMNDDGDEEDEEGDFDLVTRLTGTKRIDDVSAGYATMEEKLEALASEGGRFWIGGVDEDQDVHFDPYYDNALDADEGNEHNHFLE